ncbi:hypothetical protein R6Z07F_000752 [Ovis aries]
MAVCLPSLSDLRAEPTLMEVNQELRLQLAKYKQDFRDLTEKFLISRATAYSLANQLQKYKCEACKDIIESVLGEKLLFEVRRPAEKPADKPMLDERLRTCDTLIRSQARELTQLRQTLQHGKDDSVLLKQHLKDLLTHNDQGSHQGQGFRERLSEGYRLAERIAYKLSPEIYEDGDDEQAQEKLTPSMELQEVEKREVPEESKDECGLMPSILQGSSDSHQPYSNDKFKDLEADLGQDGACGCSYAKEEEIPTNVSDNENYHKPMSGQELPFPSVNLQDDEKKVVFQQSQDECISVPSTLQEGSAFNQPYSDGKFAFDEETVASAVDEACGCSHAEEDEIPTGLPENQNDHDDMKRPDVVAPRFSRQLPQMRGNGVPRDSLDEYYLTYSVLPGLSDSFWPYRSNAIFSLEDVDVSYAWDVTKNLADLEDEEDQDIISSRDKTCGPKPLVGQDSVGAASAFYLETQGDPTGGGSASVAAPFGGGAGPPMTIDRQSRRVLRGLHGLVPHLPVVQGPALLRAAGFGPRLLSGRRQSTGAQSLLRGTQTFWSPEQDELGAGAGEQVHSART